MTKKLIIGGIVFILICIGLGVYFGRSQDNISKLQNDLGKLYGYQAECQTKIIELETKRNEINKQIDYLSNEHNKTFQVIQEYKKQLLTK